MAAFSLAKYWPIMLNFCIIVLSFVVFLCEDTDISLLILIEIFYLFCLKKHIFDCDSCGMLVLYIFFFRDSLKNNLFLVEKSPLLTFYNVLLNFSFQMRNMAKRNFGLNFFSFLKLLSQQKIVIMDDNISRSSTENNVICVTSNAMNTFKIARNTNHNSQKNSYGKSTFWRQNFKNISCFNCFYGFGG